MKGLRYLLLLCTVRALICPDKHSCFNKECVCLRPNKHLRQMPGHQISLCHFIIEDRQWINQTESLIAKGFLSVYRAGQHFLSCLLDKIKSCPVLCFRWLEITFPNFSNIVLSTKIQNTAGLRFSSTMMCSLSLHIKDVQVWLMSLFSPAMLNCVVTYCT